MVNPKGFEAFTSQDAEKGDDRNIEDKEDTEDDVDGEGSENDSKSGSFEDSDD